MITLLVTYKCKHGQTQHLVDALKEKNIDSRSKNDAGNLGYDFYLPIDGSDNILLVENWTDEEASRSHCLTEHYKELCQLKKEYVEETIIKKIQH